MRSVAAFAVVGGGGIGDSYWSNDGQLHSGLQGWDPSRSVWAGPVVLGRHGGDGHRWCTCCCLGDTANGGHPNFMKRAHEAEP